MPVQINPNLEESVSEIPPDIKKCIEETAYTAAKIGDARALEFERQISAADVKNAVFHFLHPSDPYHACYKKKVAEYRSQLQPPVRSTCDPELPVREPLFDVPDKLSFFPEAITPKELGSINLTAVFVARYGKYFWDELIKRVGTEPLLDFVKPAGSRFKCFYQPVYSYSRVVRRCRKPETSKEDLVDGFLGLLQAERVGTALIDLPVLEYVANIEDKEMLHPSMMMNPPQQMQGPVAAPPPDWIKFVEHTARFVSDHDDVMECERRMLAADVNKESFSFLVSSDRYHAYYQKKLTEYRARFQPPVKETLFDGPYNLTLPEGIAPEEQDYIKLTAMFVARFGKFFLDEVMKKVANQPQFEFIKSADSRFKYYSLLFSVYSRVLRCSQEPETSSANLVDDFLGLFQANEQQDEGSVMAMIDLPTFECVMDMEDNVLLLKHALNPPPRMSPSPPLPLPEPKRQKLDESALVPEDQSLAQHPGSSKIWVSVPNVDVEQVIEPPPENLAGASQSNPNLEEAVFEPPPEIKKFIDMTSQYVAPLNYSDESQFEVVAVNADRDNKGPFSFLSSTDPYHAYYLKKVVENRSMIGAWTTRQNLFYLSPPHKFASSLPIGITPKELEYMKVAALFVARYGMFFLGVVLNREVNRVADDPRFEFLKSDNIRYKYYSQLVAGYSKVVRRSKTPRISADDLVKGFLSLFKADEQQGEGAVEAMIDLRALEYVANIGERM